MVRDFIIIQAESFRILKGEDGKNWILQLWKEGGINPKTKTIGKGHWDNQGYYGKLEDLSKALLNSLIEVPERTLQNQIIDLLTELKRIEKLIAKQLKEATKNES